MNIAIHIPRPVRIRQGPLDVTTRGDLAIQVREGSVATRGGLAIDRGALSFFGERFELVRGRLEFSDAHPAGWMALELERRLPDSTMRDLAKTPASSRARISLTGPLARTQIAFAGATNSEFADVVAVSNLGHGRLVTGAGLAASQSVQAPHGERLLMTAFFAMLVPRLLFLDRLAAWSDPADGGYGKIQHVEADRYVAGDRARVRAVARPPAPGRSTAEVHVDRLLRLDDTTAAGIGLRAGDRIGGGVGVFVEWSSAR